ncbi:MAG: SUMF1/EgtB/PvdO family nonheme iron enzyme [Verrucomicrobia bacterium]|nr:SUMF1/EgtB/PvdO family nonheme iron enzyme [Verrucomicrobiota bacterium]
MKTTKMLVIGFLLAALPAGVTTVSAAAPETPLTAAGQKLEARYADQLKPLQAEIEKALPKIDEQKKAAFLEAAKDGKSAAAQEKVTKAVAELNLYPVLTDAKLDAKLVPFVVLQNATPRGLAEFAQQGAEQTALVDKLLADPELMKQMLVADGAKENKYGRAMEIYTAIQKVSAKAKEGVLQRLALAIALEHAVPVKQDNPVAKAGIPATVDPVKRYLAREKTYLDGELDSAFKDLTAWDLRFVVDGDEPDEVSAWGRQMLRNYRPDLVTNPDYGWRYVQAVSTDVKYGSGDVKFDRPELQNYQNIIMNGGVCGRRAFFGRFILRAFGIPTTARPQSGHGALVHWTPKGWVPCLGGGWGSGWTGTRYKNDLDFLATTQARESKDAFLQVKRAQWFGDVAGEVPVYELHEGVPGFWYGVSLYTQRDIIEKAKAKVLAAVGTNLGESNETGEKPATETVGMTDDDKKVAVGQDGVITIPAAAYSKPSGNTAEVRTIKSFAGGQQILLPRFAREGLTILRGGGWRGDASGCKSGARLLSGGYGAYNNWGFRAAITPSAKDPQQNLTFDLGGGVAMDFVFIKPGTFVMGGESTTDGRFECVEVPKHEVTITKGFYLGKYEVTQAQYQLIMGENPSGATKDPNCPADTVGEADAVSFCAKLAGKSLRSVRLPTEAEWEYACRAGSKTAWFFGDDPAQLGDYAWFQDNDGGKSHPVGQKKPNPWGLYDIHGNVCERVADTYVRDYYAKSPKEDPVGPARTGYSSFDYTINVPRPGTYALTALVVTNNYHQKINVSANGDGAEVSMVLPFTCGQWKDSEPVTLTLKQGENTLQFSRTDPPQAGIAVKSFTLKPVR